MTFERMPNETDAELIYRIGKQQPSIGTWQDVADILNGILGTSHTESKFRKQFHRLEGAAAIQDSDVGLDEGLRAALRLERVKLADERAALNRSLREQARADHVVEMVRRVISDTVVSLPHFVSIETIDPQSDLVVHLTDTHVGAVIDSPFNKYNTDVFYERLRKYYEKIVAIKSRHNAKNCHLVLGGDLISGLIHFGLRVESNENVIEQVKIVSEAISEFTYALARVFDNVAVHAVSGNHSRAVADKKLSLKGEDFDALIPFYMSARLHDVDNVSILTANPEPSIAVFHVCDHLFCAVHGDKDEPKKVVQSMTALVGSAPAVVMIAHRHENAITPVYRSKVVQSGTMMGMSEFSIDSRMVCNPEQWVLVVTDDNPIEAAYSVNLY